MVSASGPFGGSNQAQVSEAYRYDAIGNTLEKAGVLYTYGDPTRPNAVTSTSDGRTYTYDANGNPLGGSGATATWDADNRLQSVTIGGSTTAYAYDVEGRRVRKAVGGSVTRYPFVEYEVGSTGVVIKRFGGVARTSTGQVLFYHPDRLGGLHVVTNASGLAVQAAEYDPWGRVSRIVGSGDPSIRFAGEPLDSETGFYYLDARYYDHKLGRFISRTRACRD